VKKIIQFILFLSIGVVIMTLVYQSQNSAFMEQCRIDGVPTDKCSLTDKLLTDFSTIHFGWLLSVVGAFTLSNVFRALRWQMMFPPMGYKTKFQNGFLTILLGYFANLGLPRMGEVVRAGSLARYEGIPLEKVVGTMVVDRLMDFLCLGVVVGLAFAFQGGTLLQFLSQNTTDTDGDSITRTQLFYWLLGITTILVVSAWQLRFKLMKTKLFIVFEGLLLGFRDGLRSVFHLEKPWLFILYSVGIWVMFYFQCYWNLLAFPPTAQLGMQEAIMVFVFGTLGFVIPSPGGMGTFHALTIAGLALYGVSGSDGFSYANIAFFTIQIFYNIIGGIISLILLPIINKRKREK
jgi:uncharacterized membrane protein YbhN (UPF0104 family)